MLPIFNHLNIPGFFLSAKFRAINSKASKRKNRPSSQNPVLRMKLLNDYMAVAKRRTRRVARLFFVVPACHLASTRWVRSTIKHCMHCPHTLSSALVSINLYEIKIYIRISLQKYLGNTKNRTRDRWVRSKDAIHCAMRPPLARLS